MSDRDDQSRIEHELRSGRPEPRRELLDALVSRAQARPAGRTTPRRRPRLALATAFVVLVVALLASFGGAGYATSSVKSAARAVSHVVTGKKDAGDRRSTQTTRRRGDDDTDGKGSSGNGPSNGGGKDDDGKGGGDSGYDPRGGSSHHDDDPSWVHQYSRWILVCYPFRVGKHTVYRTIVVPRAFVSSFVPPGSVGACGWRGRDG